MKESVIWRLLFQTIVLALHNRLELDFILVMRTKGQNKGKNISRNVNIFDPHTTGYFKQVLMMATMEENE